MTVSEQNKEDINASTVRNICRATALELSKQVSIDDAIYQLTHLRDYYWYQIRHLPKLNSTELTNSTNKTITAGSRLTELLSEHSHELFRHALRAAATDRWGSADEVEKIITETNTCLNKLVELSQHLAARKDEYRRLPAQAKLGWPLQGPGHRALYPFLRAHSKTKISARNATNDLIDNYIPSVYELFFPGNSFTANYDNQSGVYTGPALRFSLSIFRELKLGDHRSDTTFSQIIAERIRSVRKKRVK